MYNYVGQKEEILEEITSDDKKFFEFLCDYSAVVRAVEELFKDAKVRTVDEILKKSKIGGDNFRQLCIIDMVEQTTDLRKISPDMRIYGKGY